MDLRSEWEWSWKTPLLLHPTLPPESLPTAVRAFLATPIEKIDFDSASDSLAVRLAELRTNRLGTRFERIQEALFRAHPDTESLRTGIIITGRTEIDLLHRLRTWPEGWIHWEVAVKFYLCMDAGGTLEVDRFVGPSLQDTLGKKIRTILGKQLPILEDPAVRDSIGVPVEDPVLALPLVRGIFYRPHDCPGEIRRPARVTADGARGFWVPCAELAGFLDRRRRDYPDGNFRILEDRKDWIRMSSPELGTPLKGYLNSPLERSIESHFLSHLTGVADMPMPTPLHGVITSPGASALRIFVVDGAWRIRAEAMLDRWRYEGRIKS